MFAAGGLHLSVGKASEKHSAENFGNCENGKSPKENDECRKWNHAYSTETKFLMPNFIKKVRRSHCGTAKIHLFLMLPRRVASGLAACFMKAEGLMPTMFLNCLEKW